MCMGVIDLPPRCFRGEPAEIAQFQASEPLTPLSGGFKRGAKMTIGELVTRLNRFNPSMEVMVEAFKGAYAVEDLRVEEPETNEDSFTLMILFDEGD